VRACHRAEHGYLYLRVNIVTCLNVAGCAATPPELNLLGANILGQAGFDFDIEIHLGAELTSAARSRH